MSASDRKATSTRRGDARQRATSGRAVHRLSVLKMPNGLWTFVRGSTGAGTSQRSLQAARFRPIRSPVPPQEGIRVEAVGFEPRFVPVDVLLAEECEVLSRRHAETRTECPAELGHSAKAAGLCNLLE